MAVVAASSDYVTSDSLAAIPAEAGISLRLCQLPEVRGEWTYIMTNDVRGVLYLGVAPDLARRAAQHQAGEGSSLCRKYRLTRLVLAEHHEQIEDAIRREKLLKTWKRACKIELIERSNPQWRDL